MQTKRQSAERLYIRLAWPDKTQPIPRRADTISALKILRNIKKLSQDDIANELNIDKSYYSKVERGLTNPTIVYLRNLAQILEVELNELVDEHINI